MAVLLDERPGISKNDDEIVAVNFNAHLNDGETLTGIPTVQHIDDDGDAVADSNATISGILVNTVAYTEAESGNTVPIGKAVLFSFVATEKGRYRLRVSVTTSPTIFTSYTPAARSFVRDILLYVV